MNLYIINAFFYLFVSIGYSQISKTEEDLSIKRFESVIMVGFNIYKNDPEKALLNFNEAKLLADKLNDKTRKARALNGLGLSYRAKSNYEKAFYNFDRALKELENTQSYETISAINNNIGVLYESFGLFDLALNYYIKAEKEIKKSNATDKDKFLNNTLENIGIIYKYKGDYDRSIEYINLSIEILLKVENLNEKELNYRKARGLMEIGMNYLLKGDVKKAEHYLLNNLLAITDNGVNNSKALAFYYIAELYNKKSDYKNAMLYAHKAESFVNKSQDQKNKINIYFLLSELYETTKNDTVSLRYFKKAFSLNEIFFGTKNTWNSYKVRQDFKSLENEQALIFLEKEKKIDRIQKTLWILVALLTILFSLLIIRMFRLKFIKEKTLNKEKQEVFKLELNKTKESLELKQKELTTAALQLLEKEQELKKLSDDLLALKGDLDKSHHYKIEQLQTSLVRKSSNNWSEFKQAFEQVNNDFFKKLKKDHPSLTSNDLKLCSLLKLNFSSKEIANLIGISSESVKMNRYRLRKKIGLQRGINLVDFINNQVY